MPETEDPKIEIRAELVQAREDRALGAAVRALASSPRVLGWALGLVSMAFLGREGFRAASPAPARTDDEVRRMVEQVAEKAAERAAEKVKADMVERQRGLEDRLGRIETALLMRGLHADISRLK